MTSIKHSCFQIVLLFWHLACGNRGFVAGQPATRAMSVQAQADAPHESNSDNSTTGSAPSESEQGNSALPQPHPDMDEDKVAEVPIVISSAYLTCVVGLEPEHENKPLACLTSNQDAANQLRANRDWKVFSSHQSVLVRVEYVSIPDAHGNISVSLILGGDLRKIFVEDLVKSGEKLEMIPVVASEGSNIMPAPPTPVDEESRPIPAPPTPAPTYEGSSSIPAPPAPETSSEGSNTVAAPPAAVASSEESNDIFAAPPPEPAGTRADQASSMLVNLLQNGSFETLPEGQTLSKSGYDYFSSLPGWTLTPSKSIAVLYRYKDWLAADGEKYLELNNFVGASIEQRVPTIVGKRYRLTFQSAAKPGSSSAENMLKVFVDSSATSYTLDDSANRTPVWKEYSREFTANSSQTSIKFEEYGSPNSSFGPLLDHVSLHDLP